MFTVNSADDDVDVMPGDDTCATMGGAARPCRRHGGERAAWRRCDQRPGGHLHAHGPECDARDQRRRGAVGRPRPRRHDGISIVGAGSALTIIDGNDADRVFDNFIEASLSGLTIQNGHSTTGLARGGGINNLVLDATLTLTDVVITDNSATSGGGIFSNGPLTMMDCTVSGNTATMFGGGIYNADVLVAEGVTLNGNTADRGGGVRNVPDGIGLTLTNASFSGNTATTAGGGLSTAAAASPRSRT
jgi:predicted outer membrane repeat protein